ncbi:MAG: DUF5723 family protein [Bacteroidota bacterium]|nr:DUF5723 family protein [Bacteroidota bacterium]MDP4205626.1 DUF5723 family protein [Bacteroidota bacterium]
MRTGYFMDGYSLRHNLNPALRPATGYISIPGLGDNNFNFSSNSLTLDKLFYPNGLDNELVTFLHPSVDANAFLNSLADVNTLRFNMSNNLLSFGFFCGKSFWSFGINLKSDNSCSIPKDIFTVMKLGVSNVAGQTFNLTSLRLSSRAYGEAALGYSRPVNEKLTLGGKLKYLVGMTDMDAYFNKLEIQMTPDVWRIKANGQFNISMQGLKPEFSYDSEFKKNYISGFDNESNGIGGMGAAIDLGATYNLTDNLTLSAALLDLGAIKWKKDANTTGISDGEYNYRGIALTYENSDIPSADDQSKDIQDSLINIFHYTAATPSSRTTRLQSTFNAGAEYSILNKKISFGVLSSTRFRGNADTFSELTTSVNFKPISWFSTAFSYSWIQSDFKTFGAALNFSPCWINFFVASDYVLTRVTPQYIPISQKAVNFQVGVSIPIAGNRCRF